MTSMYAATDEKHDPAEVEQGGVRRAGAKGAASKWATSSISAQNIRRPMNATVAGADGKHVHPEMGSYGVGVSRLVGAVIEASHDEAGIIWPDSDRAVQGGDS